MQSRPVVLPYSASAARGFAWGTQGLRVRKTRTFPLRERRSSQTATTAGQTILSHQRCLPMELVLCQVSLTQHWLLSGLAAATAAWEYTSRALQQRTARIRTRGCRIQKPRSLRCSRYSRWPLQLICQHWPRCAPQQKQLRLQAQDLVQSVQQFCLPAPSQLPAAALCLTELQPSVIMTVLPVVWGAQLCMVAWWH